MIDVVSYLNNGLSATPETREPSKDLGKDAFMQLLVTQMAYQNPLEPMDNTEFIAQLAQFSALEQQQNIAAGIELLALSQTAATNSQMVNLIGKRVVVPGSMFSIDEGKPVELRFETTEGAGPAELLISNDQGEVVRRIPMDGLNTGMNKYTFDGKDASGNTLESGNYTYSILSYDGSDIEGLTKYANYLVDSVSFEGSAIMLKSQDVTISLNDVSEVIKN
jgi:flagellar basal-body rod modification protein FlgD